MLLGALPPPLLLSQQHFPIQIMATTMALTPTGVVSEVITIPPTAMVMVVAARAVVVVPSEEEVVAKTTPSQCQDGHPSTTLGLG